MSLVRNNCIAILALLPVLAVTSSLKFDDCFRKLSFLQAAKGDRLTKNVISSHDVASSMECGQQCLQQMICVAFNHRSTTTKSNEPNCQLTNSTEGYRENDANVAGDWTFHKAVDERPTPPCLKNPCKNGGECVPNVCQPESFSCKCGFQYKGKLCEVREVFKSCQEALNITSTAQDGVYKIETNTKTGFTKVYCQMASFPGCPGGGWTMAIKMDGAKDTFEYFSPYWSDRQSYNLAGGLSGCDDNETKLPTYWSTSFNELCVGMKAGTDLNLVSINYTASSLFSLFADGVYRATHIGRAKWKSLISGSSLQHDCNKEGFNAYGNPIYIRLGFIGNNQQSCSQTDSFIGLGAKNMTERGFCYKIPSFNTAGNIAMRRCSADNGDKDIRVMGYILVR